MGVKVPVDLTQNVAPEIRSPVPQYADKGNAELFGGLAEAAKGAAVLMEAERQRAVRSRMMKEDATLSAFEDNAWKEAHNRKGEDAIGLEQEMLNRYDKWTKAQKDQLGGDRDLVTKFEEMSQQRRDAFAKSLRGYEFQQGEEAYKNNYSSSLDNATSLAVTKANDTGVADEQIRRQYEAADARAVHDGWSPEQLERERRGIATKIYASVIEEQMRQKMPGVKSFYERVKGTMDGAFLAQHGFAEKVEDYNAKKVGWDNAKSIIAALPDDLDAQVEEANKIDNETIRKVTVENLKEQASIKEVNQRRVEDDVVGNLDNWTRSGDITLEQLRADSRYIALSGKAQSQAERNLEANIGHAQAKSKAQSDFDQAALWNIRGYDDEDMVKINISTTYAGVGKVMKERLAYEQKKANDRLKNGTSTYMKEVGEFAGAISDRMKFSMGQRDRFKAYMKDWFEMHIDEKTGKRPSRKEMLEAAADALQYGDTADTDWTEYDRYKYEFGDIGSKPFHKRGDQAYEKIRGDVEKPAQAATANPPPPGSATPQFGATVTVRNKKTGRTKTGPYTPETAEYLKTHPDWSL